MQAPSDNVVIYGHHMNDGSMFAHLEKFKSKGRVLTYEQIYDKVWGEISAGNEKDTVGFHIRNLRKKLCDTNSHFSIDSVREIGYRFNSQ